MFSCLQDRERENRRVSVTADSCGSWMIGYQDMGGSWGSRHTFVSVDLHVNFGVRRPPVRFPNQALDGSN